MKYIKPICCPMSITRYGRLIKNVYDREMWLKLVKWKLKDAKGM